MTQVKLWTCLAGIPFSRFYLRELAKLMLRAARYPRQTLRWLAFLNSDPVLQQLTRAFPRMVEKIYHPYLNDKMRCRERLSVLSAHYRFLLQLGFGSLLVRAARAPVQLFEIHGKYDGCYQFQLCAVAPMEREGDLLLQLIRDSQVVYSVVFSFFNVGRAMAVGIGCIQGPAGDNRLDAVRTATHEFQGLRPKGLMVHLVRQLGRELGCLHVVLVGNGNRAADYAIRTGQVHADYDALWREMGATSLPSGDFLMPCGDLAPLDLDLIPSKKRSEAKKRHALLLRASQLLRESVHHQRALPGEVTAELLPDLVCAY